jgi:hypothetical protein
MMHPSEVEDADWMPPLRRKEKPQELFENTEV